jgi:hypothetical protein
MERFLHPSLLLLLL